MENEIRKIMERYSNAGDIQMLGYIAMSLDKIATSTRVQSVATLRRVEDEYLRNRGDL